LNISSFGFLKIFPRKKKGTKTVKVYNLIIYVFIENAANNLSG